MPQGMRPLVHPGILVSRSMLDGIRAAVLAQTEPTYSAFVAASTGWTPSYVELPPVQLGNLSYVPHPQRVLSNGTGINPMREDAFAAYTHALLWTATRDERHALKAIAIMDCWVAAWVTPVDLKWGLQVAWAAAVWPRAAEIIKHVYARWEGADAFGRFLTALMLPLVCSGASTNGNIGLVMTEASIAISVFTDNSSAFDFFIERWRRQAPAYLYLRSDGPTPKRPPRQRYLENTSPTCSPACTDAEMVTYWHGQRDFVADGICQETCRDLGHTQLGLATLINTAETAYHQGIDLYAEEAGRILAAAELHASLLGVEPATRRQPVPSFLCGGRLRGAVNASATWWMLHHHFHTRRGLALPNVSALLPQIRPSCWDQICWETLTHGGSFNASAASGVRPSARRGAC